MAIYNSQSISGYNSNPPSDDGQNNAQNLITWAKHKSKLADPVKTLAEAINTELSTAFGKIPLSNVTAHSSAHTVVESDRGKLLSVTGTTTITLIDAASGAAGFTICILNNGTDTVTIDGDGAETVNGAATITLEEDEYAWLVCDASNWSAIISKNPLITAKYPPNYLSGGNVTINSSDSDHDVDIAEIHFRNSDDDLNFDTTSTFTKQLDATFAAGTDAGGMASGESLPTSGTIYLFAITNDSTGAEDFIADTSATGANIDAGWSIQETHAYTTEPYIAKISTDGSANIKYISFRKTRLITETQDTTSGTAITFSSIPSGVKSLSVSLDDVSTDGSEELMIQIGDSGGLESSGYVGGLTHLIGSTNTINSSDYGGSGYELVSSQASGDTLLGIAYLELKPDNTWLLTSNIVDSGSITDDHSIGTGKKSLSAELDRITLTSTNTPDTFDGGSVSIQYEVRK